MAENLEQLLDYLQTSLLVKPNDAFKRFQLGSTYGKLGQPDKAIRELSRAASIKPDYFDAHYQLGLTYLATAQEENALASLTLAAGLRGDHFECQFALAKLAMKLGRHDIGAKAYDAVAKLHTEDLVALEYAGNAYLALERWFEAASCWERATKLAPDSADNFLRWGTALVGTKAFAPAVRVLRESLRLRGESEEPRADIARTYQLLGEAYARQDEHRDAINAYGTALHFDPRWAQGHVAIASEHELLGQDDDAVGAYKAALRFLADDAVVNARLGAPLRRLGRHEEAIDAFARAVSLAPENAVWLQELGTAHLRASLAASSGDKHFEDARKYLRESAHFDPSAVETQKALGEACVALGKSAEGIDAYRAALKLDPAYAEGHVALAKLSVAAGNDAEAVTAFEAALGTMPDTLDVLSELGGALLRLDRNEEAAAVFERAATAAPNDAEVRLQLGIALVRRKRWQPARNALQASLRLRPNSAPAQRLLGETAAALEENEEAANSYARALALDPEFHAGHRLLGGLYEALGRDEDALLAYKEAARLAPLDHLLSVKIGRTMTRLGRKHDAVEHFAKAVELRSDDPTSLHDLGVALARVRKPKEARDALLSAAKLWRTPDPANADDVAQVFATQRELAQVCVELGKTDEAVTAFQHAVDLDPTYCEGFRELGKLLLARGEHGPAARSLRAAVRLAADDAGLHASLGDALLAQGTHEEAADSFARAFKIATEDGSLAYKLGVAWTKAGEDERAQPVLERAVALAPNDVPAFVLLGDVAHRLEHRALAATAYARAIELEPTQTPCLVPLAADLEALGRDDEASAAYERATAAFPEDAKLHTLRAAVLLRLGDLEASAASFELAARFGKGDPEILFALGSTYARVARWSDAKQALDACVALRPDHPTAFKTLGAVAVKLERNLEAIDAYKRALELDPSFAAEAYRALADAYLARGADAEAVDAFRSFMKESGTTTALLLATTRPLLRLGRFDEAFATCERAAETAPEDPEVLLWLGIATAKVGRLDAAADTLRESLRLRPTAEAHSALGEVLAELGKDEAAIRAYGDAQAILDDPANNIALGRLYTRTDRDAQAVEALRAAVRALPEDASVHASLGRALLRLGIEHAAEAAASLERALEVDPDDADITLALGEALVALGRLDEARGLVRRSLRARPAAKGHALLGTILLRAGASDDARASFRAAIELDPRDAASHIALAQLAVDGGRDDEAVGMLAASVAIAPTYPELLALGRLLSRRGNRDEAAAAFERARDLRNEPEILFELGRGYVALGRFADAKAVLDAAAVVRSDDVAVHLLRGYASVQLGMPEDTIVAYERVLAFGPDPIADASLGLAYAAVGRDDEAVVVLSRANQDDLVRTALGRALVRLVRDREALAVLERVAAPSFEAQLARGIAAARLGRFAEAHPLLAAVAAADPSRREVHGFLGRAARALGLEDEALAAYRVALETDPELPEAHAAIGMILVVRGLDSEAIVSLENAVAAYPDDGPLRAALGGARLRRRHLDAAVATLGRAHALLPDDPTVAFQLGFAHAAKEEWTEALAPLQRATALLPDDVAAQKLLAEVALRTGDRARALGAYERVTTLEPVLLEAQLAYARLLFDDGRANDAIAPARAALAIADADLAVRLARALRASGQRAEALTVFADAKARGAAVDAELGEELVVAERWSEAADVLEKLADKSSVFGSLALAYERSERIADAVMILEEIVVVTPDDVDAWRRLGFFQQGLGRFESAARSLARARALAPEDAALDAALVSVHASNAASLVASDREAEAIPSLEHAVKARPDDGALHAAIGGAYLRAGRPAAARAALARARALVPTDGKVLRELAEAALGDAQPAEARDALVAATELAPADPALWQTRADVHVVLGETDAAVTALRRLLAIAPAPAIWTRLGTLLDGPDDAGALAAFLAVEPPDHARIGALQKRVGQVEPAARSFEKAVSQRPDDAALVRELGLLRARLREWPAARTALAKSVAIEPTVEAWKALAEATSRLGAREEAVTAYAQAIALDPSYIEGDVALGRLFLQLGRDGDAAGALERAARGGDHTVLVSLGDVRVRLGRHGEAANAFARALAARADDVDTLAKLGAAHVADEAWEPAREAYARLVEIRPDDVAAQKAFALASTRTSDTHDALTAYTKAVALDPAYEEGHLALAKLHGASKRLPEMIASAQAAIALGTTDSALAMRVGHALRELGRDEEAAKTFEDAAKLSHSAEAYTERGRALVALGRHAEAAIAFEAARLVDPTAATELALAYETLGRKADAIAVLVTTVAQKPADAESWLRLGALQLAAGEFAAVDSLARVRVLLPGHAGAAALLGDAYARLAQHAEAARAYRAALAIDPARRETQRGLALALRALGEHAEALTHFGDVTQIPAEDTGVLLAIAASQAELAQHEAIVATTARARALATDAELLLLRGRALQALGRHDEASTAFERVRTLRPSDAGAVHEQARALRAAGDLDGAYRVLDDARADDVVFHRLFGGIAFELGRFAPAVESLEKASWLEPGNIDIERMLGLAFARLDRRDDALAALEKVIVARPEDAEVHFVLGTVLADPLAAIARFDRALALAPKLAEAHLRRGLALEQADRLDEAARAYRDATRIKPDLVEALDRAGRAYTKLGEPAEAVLAYKQLAKLAAPEDETPFHALAAAYAGMGRHADAATNFQLALDRKPKTKTLQRGHADALRGADRLEEAIAAYGKSLLLDPDDEAVLANVTALAGRGFGREVAAVLEEARRAHVHHTAIARRAGLALADADRVADAVVALEQAAKLDPKAYDVTRRLALLYKRTGRNGDAFTAAKKALPAYPEDFELALLAAQLAAGLERHPDAIVAFEAAVKLRPDAEVALAGLAVAYRAAGNDAEAARAIAALVDRAPTAERWLELGTLRDAHGEIAKAVEAYRAAIALRPTDGAALVRLGIGLHKLRTFEESVAMLGRAQKVDPALPELDRYLGMGLLQLGKLGEAARAFDAAIVQSPEDPTLRVAQAFALQRLNRLVESANAYAEASRLGANDAAVHLNRARILEKLERRDEMAEAWRALAVVEPTHPEASRRAATAFRELERFEDAVPAYEAAVVLAPEDATLRYELGVCLAKIGNKAAARKQHDVLVGLDPARAGFLLYVIED